MKFGRRPARSRSRPASPSSTVSFSADGKPGGDHLGIALMIQKPGPVDLNQPMGNGIGYWKGGAIYSYEKGKSQCTMMVTKLTPSTVEGTAECAVVNEQGGSGKNPLTTVKFFATTAMAQLTSRA